MRVQFRKQGLQNYLLLQKNAHGLSVLRVSYCQGLSQKMYVVLKAANWFFITSAKPIGKFINIIWNALMATQVLVSTIRVKRRDASTIKLMVTWQSSNTKV
jgi:precorrin-6B methylase 2